MAFFVPPIPLIRKRAILKSLSKAGATSREKAKSFEETDLINPKMFMAITKRMVKNGTIKRTDEGKYYINNKGGF